MQRSPLASLGLHVACALALALPSSALALNDTCATAEAISFGSPSWTYYLNHEVSAADPVDHFRGSVPPGHKAEVWVRFLQSNGDIDVRLWNRDCTVLLASSSSTTDDELATWVNFRTVPMDVVCEVFVNGSAAVPYALAARGAFEFCTSADALEPNDDCASAKVIPFNSFEHYILLTAQQGDDDYYEITVPPYAQLDVLVQATYGGAELDARLYDAGCGTLLQTSSTSGTESVNLDNFSSTARTFVVHVYLADSTPCSNYTLKLQGQPGSNYCTSSSNSTFGGGARMFGLGSASVTADNLELLSLSAPFATPGIFFYSPNPGSVPFGNGTLCVTQPLVRSQVFQAEDFDLRWNVNIGAQASSIYPIVPGATYNFQCWYRDNGGSSPYFNLSDGYRVAFMP